MKTIYCISGLGADERAFSRLEIEGYSITCLPWLTPAPKETIGDYAKRMSDGIKDERPVLMGLSFGGIMCIEIARQIPVEKVILISSIKCANELPGWMKAAGMLRLNRIFPMRSNKFTEAIQNRNLGISTPEEKEMVSAYRLNAPQEYVDWAINEILNWRNSWYPAKIYQVHGDADKLFPIRKVAATHIIKGGGHFMIMNKATEVSAALQQILLT
ncbi:MAG: alpha/beta hydrolase [Ferruginibacter sp.]